MKRFLLAWFILLLCVAVGAWLAWPRLTETARGRLVRIVSQALGCPIRVEQLSVSLLPPRVRLRGVVLGAEPLIMAQVASIDVRVWALASLAEWRPVLSARIEEPMLDLTQLPAPQPPTAERRQGRRGGVPSIRVKELVLKQGQLRFRLRQADALLTLADFRGQFDSRSAGERVSASLEAAGLVLERQNQHLSITQVRLEGGADQSGPFVNTATVSGDAIKASMGAVALAHRYGLAATIDAGAVCTFLDEHCAGTARLNGTLSGALINPSVDADLAVDHVAVGQRTFGDLTAHLTREGQALRVVDLNLVGQLGHVSGAADLKTAGEFPLRAEVNAQGVDVGTLLAAFGRPLEFHNEIDASAALNGSLRPLRLDVTGRGAVQRTDQQPPLEVATFDLTGSVEPGAADIHVQFAQGKNRLNAQLALKQSQLDGRADFQAPDLATLGTILPAPLGRLQITGQMQSAVTLSGSTTHPTVGATLAVNGLTLMGAPFRRIAGTFTIEGTTLTTPGVRIETGAGGADLSGVVALAAAAQNDWRVAIHGLDTDSLVAIAHGFTTGNIPVSGGKLDGSIRARGTWPRAEVGADLRASGLYVSGEPLDRVDIKATGHLPDWMLHVALVHAASESVTIDGSGSGAARVQLGIDSTPIQLAGFRGASQHRVTGTVAVHARVSGKPLAPEGIVRVNASDLGFEGRQLGDAVLTANGRDGAWVLAGAAFGHAIDLDARLRMGAEYPYAVTARLHDLQLARLLSTDPSLQVVTGGEITLTGSAKALATPSGSVRIGRFEVQHGEYRVAAAEPIRIDVDGGRFRIRSFELAARDSRLSVAGEFATSGQMDVQARGDGDLVLLEFVGRPFNSARGQFTVTAHVRRTPATGWELDGQARLRDATLDLGLPIAFTDTNGSFTLAGSRVQIDTLDGKAGGGGFHVDGAINLSQGPGLAWKFREVAVSPTQGLEARANGNGQVQGTWKAMTVSGEVDVLSALYDRNIELADLVPFFREQVTPAPLTRPPTTEIHLELRLHAPGGLYVDNNFAKAELTADLHVGGSADKPEVTGTIEFVSGAVTFRQRTFTVTAGAIDLRDRLRLNPVLNITAESEIATTDADYTVTVSVTGTADKPRVQFSADDPNLSQNDIVSLITFGKTAAQLQREGGGVSAADALALLPTGAVTGRFGKLIGVNRFEIEAAQSRNAGAIEPRVSIGKDITDQFRASISSTFGVSAERLVQLEYRLTPRISLLGTWEGQTESQAGAFGGDVKFRYEFRRLPLSLLSGSPSGLQTPSGDEQ